MGNMWRLKWNLILWIVGVKKLFKPTQFAASRAPPVVTYDLILI